jgi:hypothetical protein
MVIELAALLPMFDRIKWIDHPRNMPLLAFTTLRWPLSKAVNQKA